MPPCEGVNHQVYRDAGAANERKTHGSAGNGTQQQGMQDRNTEIPDHGYVQFGFTGGAGHKG